MAMSDAPIGVTAVIALAILVLSFLIPGWAASALGLAGAHAHLLDWIRMQEGPAFLALWLVYGLAGLCMLLVGVMAVVGTGSLLARALLDFLVWALRTSAATALLLGHLMFWPLHVLAGVLRDILEDVTAYVAAQLRERRELRRLYREDFARDFPTFRAFRRFYRAVANGEDPEYTGDDPWSQRGRTRETASGIDPYKAALRLLGLPEEFTKADLQRRFRTLIKGVHPDVVGPNELATQLNDAYTLIKERKGWT
jgi:hypothetical protein